MLTEHEAPAFIAPPLRLMLLLPAVAVNVPPQVLLALAGLATTEWEHSRISSSL